MTYYENTTFSDRVKYGNINLVLQEVARNIFFLKNFNNLLNNNKFEFKFKKDKFSFQHFINLPHYSIVLLSGSARCPL